MYTNSNRNRMHESQQEHTLNYAVSLEKDILLMRSGLDHLSQLYKDNIEELRSLQHNTLLLQDAIAEMRLQASEALECMSCVSNIYAPEHLNFKWSLDKPQRLKLKGVLDFLAIVQKKLAIISEIEELTE